MVLSVIKKGSFCLVIVAGTKNNLYIKILEKRLFPQVSECFRLENFLVMHDSASCHKAENGQFPSEEQGKDSSMCGILLTSLKITASDAFAICQSQL